MLLRSNVDLDEWRFFSEPGHRPILGTFREEAFELRCRQEGRNSFMPKLAGRVQSHPEGARIALRMGMDTGVKVLVVFWLSAVALFQLIFLLIGLGGGWSGERWVSFAPSGMFLFGIASCVVGRALSRGDEGKLIRFLEDLLADAPGAGSGVQE